jgi:hypothetical protein
MSIQVINPALKPEAGLANLRSSHPGAGYDQRNLANQSERLG